MSTASSRGVRRRSVFRGAALGGLACVGLAARPVLAAPEIPTDEESALVRRLTGGVATLSDRVHLVMPPVFGNGYSVPMSLSVDSPMTEADHVRAVHVLAPRNPIIVVADFRFSPRSGLAAITTRIRLAEPQAVLAVAETSDGTLLMARCWVKVDTNGCS